MQRIPKASILRACKYPENCASVRRRPGGKAAKARPPYRNPSNLDSKRISMAKASKSYDWLGGPPYSGQASTVAGSAKDLD
ncbi:MAG: hypothetical protein Q9219_006417 [cf. Caloplaca sp. 3 TL-2023]